MKCVRCRTALQAPPYDTCEDCFDDLINQVDPDTEKETLVIEMPAYLYYNYLCGVMRSSIRKQPKQFRRVLEPFTMDALVVLREHVLATHLYAGLPMPRQTAGMRGGGRRTWKLRVEDTASFKAIVGHFFTPGDCVTGTGCLYDESAFTAWVPPLEITITARGVYPQETTQCAFAMSSGRITEHGWDFTRKTVQKVKPADLGIMQQYLSNLVFDLQRSRLAYNQAVPAGSLPLPPVDHLLLVRAATAWGV